jgi:hypothetical protein
VLEEVITSRGKELSDAQRQNVGNAMAEALHGVQIDASSLVSLDLAPQNLAQAIIRASPAQVTAFAPAEAMLYEVLAMDLSQ